MGFDKTKAVNAAEKYLAQGKIPSAIQEYRRVVEHDAQDIAALNTLGDLYARTGKRPDAIKCFLRVAEHYREQGFALKAIAVYKKIARLDAAAPGVTEQLAALYEQQGLFVEARAQYESLAALHERAGRARAALDALRRIADLDPKNTDVRLRLAEGYERESLPQEAAEAYKEAGARLLARGEAQKAHKAYTRAVALGPDSQSALQGLVQANFALGAAEEAAHVLERAIQQAPDDLELRAMLARAYVEAEDAPAAERAADALVEREASNYPLRFDVARLYLTRGDITQSVQVLARTTEAALAGRQEVALLEILNDALARDPENIEALRLLVRIYTWQRDDDRMRVTLERLAEAAQTQSLYAEERRALEHLVRLVPFDQSYHERLEALGGSGVGEEDQTSAAQFASYDFAPAAAAEGPAAAAGASEAPAYGGAPFADELITQDRFAADEPATAASNSPAGEFEWNSLAPPAETAPPPAAPADPRASFADLNEFTDEVTPFAAGTTGDAVGRGAASSYAQAEEEIHVSAPLAGKLNEIEMRAGGDTSARVSHMLAQELESADFYLAQGYTDIARDTLDMLERQYGARPEIEERRRRLPAEPRAAAPAPGDGARGYDVDAPAEPSGFSFAELTADAAGAQAEAVEGQFVFDATDLAVTARDEGGAPAPPRPVAPATGAPSASPGLDPGLAEIFAKFRDSVEEEDPAPAGADFETHYNLGLAFKEMGLHDDSIEEFQKAVALVVPQDGTPRYLQCCNMLGHCFMEKGLPRPAVLWFKKGLDAPGLTEEESQALRFELGLAHERLGELDRALDIFSEVYGTDVSYRGVAAKLRELQAKKAVTGDR